MSLRRLSVVATLVLTCAALARPASGASDASLSVEYGWGDMVRGGRWAPITVTAIDPAATRGAVVEVYAPQAGSYAMRVRQFVTIGPVPTVLQLYVPVAYQGYEPPVVTLRDAETGKTLARYPEDLDSFNFSSRLVDSSKRFVGASGVRTSLNALGFYLAGQQIDVGYLPPDRLPTTAAGYDALDLLVLDAPNLLRLDADRQAAIVNWVRAGGSLLMWPGDDPVPSGGPLIDVLPCRIDRIRDYLFDKRDRQSQSLRTEGVRGHDLVAAPGGERLPVLERSDFVAWRRRLGMGTIVVAPADLTLLRTDGGVTPPDLWRPLVEGTGFVAGEDARPGSQVYYNNETPDARRQNAAVRRVQDFLGDVPGAGQFGFQYIAVVLIGLMVIVGPIDWFVLRWLGRQPWTWVTTSGWIALVTFGALFIGHWFKSGTLHYRSVELVDQAGDETVGVVDVACIYSPRTTDYHLDAPPAAPGADGDAAPNGDASNAPGAHQPPRGWWQTASGEMYSRGTIRNDVDFHQTDRGNAPEAMLINVWNMRFLRADTAVREPPILSASLTVRPGTEPHVVGTITNLTDATLTNVRVRTAAGFAGAPPAPAPAGNAGGATTPDVGPPVVASIAPHATVTVDAPLRGGPHLPEWSDTVNYGRYGGEAAPVQQADLWLVAVDLPGQRARVADLRVAAGTHACVYAQVADAPPAATLREAGATQKHFRFVRALVPLEGTRAGGGDAGPPVP